MHTATHSLQMPEEKQQQQLKMPPQNFQPKEVVCMKLNKNRVVLQ